ncbi:MAG: alanine racemase, partial [Prevotella sp.]|nr:alanine racemase [Prevotella sp.]
MNYTIEKITTLIGARRIGNADAQIGWLLTDSRSLCFPEETLFFALKTPRNDGHRYISDLYRRGVRNFVVESDKSISLSAQYQDANFLVVPSPLEALQRLAERHRDEFDIPIVGITGSNGKTMVKEWLYQVLSPDKVVTRSPKSYNSQIGVPLSVWLLNDQTEVGVFEAGISQLGEMEALHDIIQPTIGVLTSIGAPHQENFRSLEEKCMEKLLLFRDAKVIIYNADDDLVSRCIRRSGFKGQKIGWRRDELLPTYQLPFYDEASIQCSLAVAATALYLGVTPEQLRERMAHLEPVAMRLEVKEGRHGCTLINDSYNSDINSLDIALDFMNRRANNADSQKPAAVSQTLILSDIFQSGMSDEALYREVNDLCIKRGVTKLIGIGPRILAQHDVFHVPTSIFHVSTDAFLHSDSFRQLHDEVVLIKGARAFGFDRITERLEQKVHETILEVNLNAVVDNLNFYRSFLKPETKLVCMVKADAYGAGAVEVAKTLQDHRVDYL